jgi:phytoene dehydrogenase-like protein
MLSALGIRDLIQPIFLSGDHANCVFIGSENRQYEFPYGIENIKRKLKGYFAGEASAIDRYFDKVRYVCDRTPLLNLRTPISQQQMLEEDFISLEEMLNGLTKNPVLRTLLCGFAMCYGVKPKEISFASHSRICLGFYESIANVMGGGAAFVKAFETKFRDYDIDICSNQYIVELADIQNRKVGRFILNSGNEISADNCILTIHPGEILKILPKKYLRPAFTKRIESYESSIGFFSVFAALEPGYEEPNFGDSVLSIFPNCDVNQFLDPAYNGVTALLILRSVEQTGEKNYKTIVALEPSFLEHVKEWKDSQTGMRPGAYLDYKKNRIDSIVKRIFKMFPQYKNRLNILDAASILTFRDYLNNFDGSAYGIKQKMSQNNLMGQLPLRNLYAAGQSSLLPGVVGAMLSSFVAGRFILNERKYNKFMEKSLG